jgi:type IV pilus assembly protein PilB
MRITDELRELVLAGATATELKQQAVQDGMVTLRQAGITKISAGETTVEEVMRVTMAD